MDREDFADVVVEGAAVADDSEFGAGRKAKPVRQVRVRGAHAHKPKDPAKECLKDRLRETMSIVARLADEKRSGADIRSAVSRLDAKTFASQLARLAGVDGGGRSSRVTDAAIDRMAEVLGWVEVLLPDRADQYLVLKWAGGVETSGQDEGSRATMWRRIDRALDKMLWGLEQADHKALETMKRFAL